jgi:hypothetical protein
VNDRPQDGSDMPLGYTTEDGHLEVRELGDGKRGYAETELGQHDRWMRQCPDLYRLYVDLLKPGFPWYLQAQLGSGKRFSSDRRLSIWQRVRILFGAPVTVVFRSPDGKCHAACSIHFGACRDWFADADAKAGRLP